VGARCPDCANVRRIPTVDVPLVFVFRGLGAAIMSGAVVGAFWAYAVGGGGFFGFFVFFIALGIGWAVSESVSLATNRKRAFALQACAVIGVFVAYLTRNIVLGTLLPQGDLWGYLLTIGAAFFAASRLSPGR
jgi:hypothetical protein